MNYGLWMSAAGLSTEMHRQDVISNNLANAQTARRIKASRFSSAIVDVGDIGRRISSGGDIDSGGDVGSGSAVGGSDKALATPRPES